MVEDISIAKASFVSLWIQALLYGAYTILYLTCVYILLCLKIMRSGVRMKMTMIFLASALHFLATAHTGITLSRARASHQR
ncbi:hypothetical protein BDV98DRAFT_588291 [Pterulicium gracile]|uniref:Uncharacterized protein n=1 Tax=Pterulicium gracile TaxID=1884261 RepID=A0A5C3R4B4_9AGAR|nr:hypothetical protein BDV98DRAFT_588291 [Pterula gracilis]